MKNFCFIFALCVSAVLFFQGCSIQKAHQAFEPRVLSDREPLLKILKDNMTEGDTLLILFDNSPTCHRFSSDVGSVIDSLERESRIVIDIHSFSYSLDTLSNFILNADSIKTGKGFDKHIVNGYGEQNMFESIIEYFDLGIQNKKILVITDGGLMPHHRNNLPEIHKKAREQKVEVTFVFLCETKVLTLTAEELEEKIKRMKYPVNYIRFNCSEIEQWHY